MQSLVVGLVVLACALHAAWSLMPAAARRFVARGVLKLGLPHALARPFRRAVQPAAGCGACGSCESERAPAQVVVVHRRSRDG